MKLEALRQKLLAAARAHPPAETVPYAFEQRILARLRAAPVADAWLLWGRGLWRAAAASLMVAGVVCALALASGNGEGSVAVSEVDLESTVAAGADVLSDFW